MAQTERFCTATFPASGWPRPFWPLRPVSPISKQGSRLCKGKISNSRRFRSWLGFQFAWDWEYPLNTSWPRIQVSVEDLELKLEKLETACEPPLNLIMLQVPWVQLWCHKTENYILSLLQNMNRFIKVNYNSKSLGKMIMQMELQSCVATAVNAGPLHIVEVFLKKPIDDCPFQLRMREILRKLIRACHRSNA